MNPKKLIIDNHVIKDDMEDIFGRNLEWKKLDGKSVFISGAYGMLASYIVFFLCYLSEYKNINVQIIAQGRNKEKAKERFGELLEKNYFHFTCESICKEITYKGSVDYIIHAASPANPRLYASNPVEVAEPNVLGTNYLLKLAKEKKSEGFLLFSSGDVYGKVDEPDKIDEKTIGMVNQLCEHSCYSESKRMAETLCYCYFKEYNIPVKILRIGHTYGPTMDIKNDPRVFSSFIGCLIENKDIEMLSDGLTKRPFCYLADAVAAYFTVLFNGKNGEAYNICNRSQFISMSEFAEITASLDKDKKIRVIYKNRAKNDRYIENVNNRDNNPSDEKLKSLGFEYHFSVKTGLRKTVEYIKEKNKNV